MIQCQSCDLIKINEKEGLKMKYKKQIKFLISCMILLFIISCAQEKTNVEDLELRGSQYFTKDNQPFSGSVYRLYDNGNVKNWIKL